MARSRSRSTESQIQANLSKGKNIGKGMNTAPLNGSSTPEVMQRWTKLTLSTSSFLTPSQSDPKSDPKSEENPQLVAYDRNHGPIKHLDASTHRLTIKSDSSLSSAPNSEYILPQPLNTVLTLSDLSAKFDQVSITCALQCAGNRRHEMRERLGEVSGLDWGDGAAMNAEWTGMRVRDVLVHAGLRPLTPRKTDDDSESVDHDEEFESQYEGLHVQFACTTQPTQDDDYYGSSVPLFLALDPERECLLATHMNGEALPPRHGFPVRAVIPGVIGARSVKWLDSIVVAGEESTNHYQRRDYKILPPEADNSTETVNEGGRDELWDHVPAMIDNPINSVVAVPGRDRDVVSRDGNGCVHVKGYAIPKGKHDKARKVKFTWVLWDVYIPCEPGDDVSIWSKATDRGGNTMSAEQAEGSWNLRGVGFNAVEGRRGIKIYEYQLESR
ncbi:uncharacterized protein Z519_10997 [Cladophialophora bantiana CBS 173.52]|uniref:Oxidoreductase molybdopterin-binding domain-containing protein n=1 Tax=Cladophialophora bantiana (strain ATCC 10958 / CBS 173.52 / CDC B-1940 / NIH 8579) TaxID=1442370 RepID=A0A0D2H540_CLAB1|nr:uncharacterized protein Z519_10997 [Cladophialophora bantiana CBS 173.52]KIW88428.1 hypothetical protein Z519_10997 [Cladophialophora bantiana CBS 173.52]